MRHPSGKICRLKSLIKLNKWILLVFLFGCISSLKQEWRKVSIVPIAKADSNRLQLMVESTWKDLGKAKYQGPLFKSKPLQESDIIQFFYYMRSFLSFRDLSKLLGIPVFIRGPHTDDTLVINDSFQFGHYHPEFPIRLRKFFIPAIHNVSFRSLTQSNYDLYIKRLARTFFAVYRKLNSNPEFYAKEVNRYNNLIVEKRLDPFYLERFVLFMKPEYTDGEDLEDSAKFKTFKGDEEFEEELVKQVIGFWIRRKIDQTDFLFFEGLSDLLLSYDFEFLKSRLE